MTDLPLKGVVVCDYGQHGAGSSCGKVLADWGAEVIKVEPFWGCGSRKIGSSMGLDTSDGENIHYEMVNGGKKSIALDLKTEEGMAIMMKLIAKSNIFFSNYRLKALRKYGLDYETLSSRFPSLIWGHINGYGTEGPKADFPGFDGSSYWASSGLLMNPSRNTVDDQPTVNAFGSGDMVTGYVLASAMAACLYQQATQGKGQSVYTSLYGAGIWQNSCVIQATSDHKDAIRKKTALFGGFFMSSDGTWFTNSVVDYPKHGPVMADLIGHPEYTEVFSDPNKDREKSSALRAEIEKFYAGYNWDEIDAMLNERDIVHCRVANPWDISTDEQAIANGYVSEFVTRSGKKAPMVDTPVKFGKPSANVCTNAPMIGENTTEILADLGYDEADIQSLFEKHVVEEHH